MIVWNSFLSQLNLVKSTTSTVLSFLSCTLSEECCSFNLKRSTMRWAMKQCETLESMNTTIRRFSFAFTSKRNHVFDIRSLTFKLIKNINSSSDCTFEVYELLSRISKFQDFDVSIFDIFVIVIVIDEIYSFSIIESTFFFFLTIHYDHRATHASTISNISRVFVFVAISIVFTRTLILKSMI